MAGAANGQLSLEESSYWGSRSVGCFQKLKQIGEDWGIEIKTGEKFALKKLPMEDEKEGFPINAIREIKILKKLQHENVIKLKEVVTSAEFLFKGLEVDEHGDHKYTGSIYLVFEYMDHDLAGLSDRHGLTGRSDDPELRFTIPQIKCYMKQLLTGLHYCHVNQVLHRDIKGANLLIDKEGNLKVADFGESRTYSTNKGNLENHVCTLWYSPPELLLGATEYGPSVDMWSVGCVFAELLHGKPIFKGRDKHDQLNKIFELCGYPNEINWPGVSRLPSYNNFFIPKTHMKSRVKEVFKQFDDNALDLLEKMLTLDPSQRISAMDALDAEYFWVDPLPCDPKSLPKYESSHQLETQNNKRHQEEQQNKELSKRQRVQHPQQHESWLPPVQQSGQAHSKHWADGHNNNNQQNTQWKVKLQVVDPTAATC